MLTGHTNRLTLVEDSKVQGVQTELVLIRFWLLGAYRQADKQADRHINRQADRLPVRQPGWQAITRQPRTNRQAVHDLQAAATSALQALPAEPGAAAVSGGVGAGGGSRWALPPG